MKRLCLILLAAGRLAAGPVPAEVRTYDANRETVIEGTVVSVVAKPGPGILPGAHLMLYTASGSLDAHLGTYALRGPNAVVVTPGEKVRVTGVTTNVGGRRLFLVRSLQAGLKVYRIRNEHGFPIRSAAPDWKGGRGGAAGGRR